MLIANVPAVLIAHRSAPRLPFALIRYIAAALFCAMGVLMLVSR
jgi:putative Ca2+/H+ antiporter (TMEM165/GDT1 family)